jgi:hypothetical protein
MGAGQLIVETQAAFLLLGPAFVMLGVTLLPIMTRALARARRGDAPNVLDDLREGIVDCVSHRGWWIRNVLTTTGWIVGMSLVALMLSQAAPPPPDAQEATHTALTYWTVGKVIMTYGTVFVWAFRSGGVTGMSYFMEVREGLDHETAQKLERLGRTRNMLPLLVSNIVSLLVLCCALVLGGNNPSLAPTIVTCTLCVAASWLAAAICVCIWHDIYDPDGGLAEKKKVEADVPVHGNVLTA